MTDHLRSVVRASVISKFAVIILSIGLIAVSAFQAPSQKSLKSSSPIDEGTVGPIMYGVDNGRGIPNFNIIYRINPATAQTSNVQTLTLAGFTITNTLGLAARPGDFTLFAIIQASAAVGGGSSRRLVTVNPTTGVCTDVGSLSPRQFASLSFRPNGVLYGVTGDGSMTDPETLFTISTVNAAQTLVMALGNGDDGEAIAFHPNGLLFHSSGGGTAVLERINVDTQAVTPSGSASGEAMGMAYSNALLKMFLVDIGGNLNTVDLTTGTRTLIGPIMFNPPLGKSSPRAIAFVNQPTASNVSLAGRVVAADGRGIANVQVTLAHGQGDVLNARTNAFGYYSFGDLEVGRTYIVTVGSKSYTFAVPSRIITLNDSVDNADFVAEP